MTWRWSQAAITCGVMLQLCGLGLDAWLHARDATLAARESVVTLSNPSHMLVAVGLAVTVLGVGARLLISTTATRRPWGWPGARIVSMVAMLAVLVLAGGAFTVAAGSGTRTYDHTIHDHVQNEHHDSVPVSWEQIREIGGMLAEAKAATEKYRDTNIARAEGYLPTTPVLYGVGAHWVNQDLLDAGVFDARRPQVLLYDYGPDGSLELAGVSWALPRPPGGAQPPHLAPFAHWHGHDFARSCIGTRGADLFQTLPLDEATCRATGNVYFREEPWFLHAWLFRPSPEGVFSHTNSTLE